MTGAVRFARGWAGYAGAVGGHADVGDCGVGGVAPEVVCLPVGDLVQQVDLNSAVPRRGGENGELQLGPVSTGDLAVGQEPLPETGQLDGTSPIDGGPVERLGGQTCQDLAREGVVAWMQRRQPVEDLGNSGVMLHAVEQNRAMAVSWTVGPSRADMPRR